MVGSAVVALSFGLGTPWCRGQDHRCTVASNAIEQRCCLVVYLPYVGIDVGAVSSKGVAGTMPAMSK